jgi:hypothetical protein
MGYLTMRTSQFELDSHTLEGVGSTIAPQIKLPDLRLVQPSH